MFSSAARTETLAQLRAQIARIARGDGNGNARSTARVVPFGIEALDHRLPSGGLLLGALHDVAGAGPDTEHGAASALYLAGVLARMEGPVLWVQQRADLFAPGLACAGLHPARVVFAEAGKDVLAAMEEGLSHPGLAAVVGEFSGRLSLVASRRLQLGAEKSGVMAALLRRSRVFNDPELAAPSAAVTRWRIAALPSDPPPPRASSVPRSAVPRSAVPRSAVPRSAVSRSAVSRSGVSGPAVFGPGILGPGILELGRALWRLELTHCRGGEPGSWIVEACDATGHLALVANLAHGSAAETGRAA